MPQLIFLIVSFALNVVSEAAILFWMRWGTFARSLRASLVMNSASFALSAMFLSLLFGALLNEIVIYLYGGDSWETEVVLLVLASIFVVLFAGSVVLDSKILNSMHQPHSSRKMWPIAIVANLVSCLLVVILFIAFVNMQQ